jgi:hypothetical protein
MRGVIWSCDPKNDGIEKLQYIRDRYIWSGVNVVREVYSGSHSWVEFDNGDKWSVASAAESSCGTRANIAWVDSRTNEEFFRAVILPTLCMWNGPRYYEFYNIM